MLKHVGKHNNRKIVVVFRKIPGEEHMCLIVYSDILPRLVHDEIMKVIESPVGQQSNELSDALFRTIMGDGRNCLDALHRDGLLKKVAASQVYMTPTSTSSMRLDELNELVDKMNQGADAKTKLERMDASQGLRDPAKTAHLDNQVLTDSDLARGRIKQAEQMRAEAQRLISEATRLEQEANNFDTTKKSDVQAKPKRKKQAA